MASTFVILLPSGEIVERVYTGSSSERFDAYLAEFPIGSGASLRYTRSHGFVEPLVRMGS